MLIDEYLTVRRVLDSTALKNLYFPIIQSYLNYGNIVLASTNTTKLKKLVSKHNQALRIVNNEFTGIRKMMVRIKVLNIFKLNIYQILNLMCKIKTNKAPCISENQFTETQQQYSTRLCKNSFAESQLVYSETKFSASSQGARLWHKQLNQQQKSLDRKTSFKESIKLTLITKTETNSLENESARFLLRVYFI